MPELQVKRGGTRPRDVDFRAIFRLVPTLGAHDTSGLFMDFVESVTTLEGKLEDGLGYSKSPKNKGTFHTDDSLLKMLYLAMVNIPLTRIGIHKE